jgi:hypothetical protein
MVACSFGGAVAKACGLDMGVPKRGIVRLGCPVATHPLMGGRSTGFSHVLSGNVGGDARKPVNDGRAERAGPLRSGKEKSWARQRVIPLNKP